jgi:hypothetical protein
MPSVSGAIVAWNAGSNFCRHHPPPGQREALPDDRLQRMIQYAAPLRTFRKPVITGYPPSRV